MRVSQTNQQQQQKNKHTNKQTDTNQPENRKYCEWVSLDFDYVFPTSVSNVAVFFSITTWAKLMMV